MRRGIALEHDAEARPANLLELPPDDAVGGPEAEAAARIEVGCGSAVGRVVGRRERRGPGGQPSSSTEGCEPEGTAASEASVSMIVAVFCSGRSAAEPEIVVSTLAVRRSFRFVWPACAHRVCGVPQQVPLRQGLVFPMLTSLVREARQAPSAAAPSLDASLASNGVARRRHATRPRGPNPDGACRRYWRRGFRRLAGNQGRSRASGSTGARLLLRRRRAGATSCAGSRAKSVVQPLHPASTNARTSAGGANRRFASLTRGKFAVFRYVVEAGYTTLLSDVDVAFRADPTPELRLNARRRRRHGGHGRRPRARQSDGAGARLSRRWRAASCWCGRARARSR